MGLPATVIALGILILLILVNPLHTAIDNVCELYDPVLLDKCQYNWTGVSNFYPQDLQHSKTC